MNHTETRLKSSDGFELFAQSWRPDGDSRAALVLIHGQSDHSSRFTNTVNALVPHGYAIYAFDQRGHGKTGGPRGHLADYRLLMGDTETALAHARQSEPGKKVFLYGHSLGGQIALNYALRHSEGLAGAIVTGPWLRLAFDPPAWKVSMGRALAGVLPELTLSNEVDAATLSHDPAIVEAYKHDPLNHGRISTRAYVEYTTAAAWNLEHAGEMKVPVLLLHGGADPLTSPAATRLFYERASSPDKTHREFPGLYHEIHNEPEKEQVFEEMRGWLERRA